MVPMITLKSLFSLYHLIGEIFSTTRREQRQNFSKDMNKKDLTEVNFSWKMRISIYDV